METKMGNYWRDLASDDPQNYPLWVKLLNLKPQQEQAPSFTADPQLWKSMVRQANQGMPSKALSTMKESYGLRPDTVPYSTSKAAADFRTWEMVKDKLRSPEDFLQEEAADVGGTYMTDLTPEEEMMLRDSEPAVIRLMETLGESLEDARERVRKIESAPNNGDY